MLGRCGADVGQMWGGCWVDDGQMLGRSWRKLAEVGRKVGDSIVASSRGGRRRKEADELHILCYPWDRGFSI